MSEVAPSQLQKKHDKVRNAITAKNREKRMRNLNITYAKSRKRRVRSTATLFLVLLSSVK